MYWVAPASFRDGLFVWKRWRKAGKCDNLSFLRVFVSQIGEVPGGPNGYALLLEGGGRIPNGSCSLI